MSFVQAGLAIILECKYQRYILRHNVRYLPRGYWIVGWP